MQSLSYARSFRGFTAYMLGLRRAILGCTGSVEVFGWTIFRAGTGDLKLKVDD